MKRIAKILLWIAGSIFAVCFVLAGIMYVANLKNIRKAAADKKLCDSRLAQLEHDLPAGTPREEVLRYLQARGTQSLSKDEVAPSEKPSDDVYVDLGRVQSTAWYCSYFEHYADLSFKTETPHGPAVRSLAKVGTRSRPFDCL